MLRFHYLKESDEMLCNTVQCGVNAGNYGSKFGWFGCGGNVLCELSCDKISGRDQVAVARYT